MDVSFFAGLLAGLVIGAGVASFWHHVYPVPSQAQRDAERIHGGLDVREQIDQGYRKRLEARDAVLREQLVTDPAIDEHIQRGDRP